MVSFNAVRRQELIEVKRQLEQTGCPILGTVLNRVEMDNYINRKYYYRSYYSHYDTEDNVSSSRRPARNAPTRDVRAKKK